MHQKKHACSLIQKVQDHPIDRASGTTADSEGQHINRYHQSILLQMHSSSYERNSYLFKKQKKQEELIQKLTEKGISWIQTNCYIREADFETTILSISVFYAFVNHSTVSKNNLESILCTCLLIASKMTNQTKFPMSYILNLTKNRQDSKTILKLQQTILSILDFNMHIQFPILEFINNHARSDQHREKAKFLTELLLLKQPSLLYDIKKTQQIFFQALKQKLQGLGKGSKIRKMVKKNNSQHLISKYQSKFNIQAYAIEDDVIDIVYKN